MKLPFLLCLVFCSSLSIAQTIERNDAGLRGDAGAVSGFIEAPAPVNFPSGATSWWHLLDVRHRNTANNYAMQFAGSFFDQYFWVRKTNGDPARPWLRLVTETNGKVGMGTDAPNAKLDVVDNSDGEQVSISKNDVVGQQGPGIVFKNAENSGNIVPIAGIETKLTSGSTGAVAGDLNLYSYSGSTKMNAMTVKAGQIGIGLNTPQTPLHVKGGVAMSGGWNKTMTLEASYPVQLFKSNTTFGGIGYDFSTSMFFWVNGSSDDVRGTGISAMQIRNNGNVLIGIETQTNSAYKLDVGGKVRANEIVVNTTGADFVFEEKYPLRSLPSLEKYILEHKRLPEIASAKTMETEGVGVSELQTKLLQKIEELTLYVIELNKKNAAQEERIKQLEVKNKDRR